MVFRHALQLRQAKLSFPSVYLAVGVFSDQLLHLHGSPATLPHVERCEVVRHCRWVDEVITDAPWQVDDQLIHQHRIDYIAIDEGTSVDPTCDKTRLKGYDSMKALGKLSTITCNDIKLIFIHRKSDSDAENHWFDPYR